MNVILFTAQCTQYKPAAERVGRLTENKTWKTNVPSPESIVAMWKPADRIMAEKDPNLVATVKSQMWSGLAITQAAGQNEGMYI